MTDWKMITMTTPAGKLWYCGVHWFIARWEAGPTNACRYKGKKEAERARDSIFFGKKEFKIEDDLRD